MSRDLVIETLQALAKAAETGAAYRAKEGAAESRLLQDLAGIFSLAAVLLKEPK